MGKSMNSMATQCSNSILSGRLLDYFANQLSPEEESTIEAHLAECDFCAARAWQAHSFAVCAPQWSAAAHGTAYYEGHNSVSTLTPERYGPRAFSRLVQRVSDALGILEQREKFDTIRDRIRRWQAALARDVATAASDLARATESSRSTGFGVFEVLQRWGWSWEGISPSQAWKTTLCSSPGGERQRTQIGGLTQASRRVSLQVNMRRIPDNPAEVEIRVAGLPIEAPSILILVLPSDPNMPPKCAELKRTGGAVWTACLEDIAFDECTIALQPLRLPP